MELLSAALAFALTMLALSIVVTSTVETIHRIVGLREKGLRVMMGHLYDTTVAPHVARSPLSLPNPRDAFQNVMTLNRAPTGEARVGTQDGRLSVDPENDRHFISRIWSGRRIGSLPLDGFMSRLGGSAFGDAIAQIAREVGPDAIGAVARDVAQQFEDAARDASEYFAARARLIAVVVGIVIAWLGYVHPYALFATYLRDPEVAAREPRRRPGPARSSTTGRTRTTSATSPDGSTADTTAWADRTRLFAKARTVWA